MVLGRRPPIYLRSTVVGGVRLACGGSRVGHGTSPLPKLAGSLRLGVCIEKVKEGFPWS
jgi:hypothetical protein